jgi:hypothetical protein
MATKKAKATLEKIKEITEFDRKVKSLSEEDKRVLTFILREFAEKGSPPTAEDVMREFDMSLLDVIQIFSKLNEFDLIYLDGKEIRGAYPFSRDPTAHEVSYEGGSVYAMCAIDALGIASMLKKDISISSFCDHCGKTIEIEIKDGKIAKKEPKETLIWVGMRYDERAATSVCTKMVFLASEKHLEEWKKENPDEKGTPLEVEEALYVGRGLFENRMSL